MSMQTCHTQVYLHGADRLKRDAPCVEKRPALKPKNVYKGGRKSQLKANRVARRTHGKRKRDREGKGRGTYPFSCAACV
jgi:hypothetical protein